MEVIQTEYNGYRFRSRAEARWAVLFDALGIKYVYEPEGYKLSNGELYLPDFYLPASQQFFEVKGVLTEKDEAKCRMLGKESGRDVIMGFSDFSFYFIANEREWLDENGKPRLDENGKPYPTYVGNDKTDCWLSYCFECKQYYFVSMYGLWRCRCCYAYDGQNHQAWVARGDTAVDSKQLKSKWRVDFVNALNKAKQIRFEHGEAPESQNKLPRQIWRRSDYMKEVPPWERYNEEIFV